MQIDESFCTDHVKHGHTKILDGMTDANLERELREITELDEFQRAQPGWRAWRRKVIQRALERGVITSDPGGP